MRENLMSQKELAEQFFQELAVFTERWVKANLGANQDYQSPWQSGVWGDGSPLGGIIHFTADESLERVMRWFLVEKFNARCSAHAVVATEWTESMRELAQDLQLVSALPVPVLQPVSPRKVAWHATWTNNWAYGIENINIGQLKNREGQFYSWRPRDRSAEDWTTLWDIDQGEPMPLFGKWWCPYPTDQLETNAFLLKYLNILFDQSLERERVLGHECVQANKMDPGPSCPVFAIRRALYATDWRWLDDHRADVMHGHSWREVLLCGWYNVSSGSNAWGYFEDEAKTFLGAGKKWDGTTLALRILGYAEASTEITIRIFQRMMDLGVDGVVGKKTRQALLMRLQDRGFVSK
jgi:hypothetical protein